MIISQMFWLTLRILKWGGRVLTKLRFLLQVNVLLLYTDEYLIFLWRILFFAYNFVEFLQHKAKIRL